MTLPAGVVASTDKIPQIGIGLAFFPRDSEFGLEVQRAPDDGGGDPDVGSAVLIATLPPSTRFFLDYRESQDATWHYRWRHVRASYTEGAFTPWLAARARQIPHTIPDSPLAPTLDASLHLDPSTNEVLLEINAAPWVRSVLWEVDTSGSWPDLDDGGTTCTNLDADGDASISTGTILTLDQTARVEVRFYDADSCGGNAVGTLRLAMPLVSTPPSPEMAIVQSQAGAVGTLSITVKDPSLMATALEFAEKTDAGDFGAFETGWSTSSGVPGADATLSRTKTISMVGKHNVAIMVKLEYTEQGVAKGKIVPISFDSNLIAEVTGIEIDFDGSDGTILVSAGGDEDSADCYVTAAADAEPSDPTVSVHDATFAGRSGTVDTAIICEYGELAWVKVGFANSDGSLGPVVSAKFRRPTGSISKSIRFTPQFQGNVTSGFYSIVGSNFPIDNTLNVGSSPVVLPHNVTITAVRVRHLRTVVGDLSSWIFYEQTDVATNNIANGIHTTTGPQVNAVTGLTHVSGATSTYVLQWTANAVTNSFDVILFYIEFDYTAHDVNETL